MPATGLIQASGRLRPPVVETEVPPLSPLSLFPLTRVSLELEACQDPWAAGARGETV